MVLLLMMMILTSINGRQVPEQVCHPKPVTECHPVARKVPRKVRLNDDESLNSYTFQGSKELLLEFCSHFSFPRFVLMHLLLPIPITATIPSLCMENKATISWRPIYLSSPQCLLCSAK